VIPVANFISDFWNDQLVEHDRQWLFLVLLGFVGAFAFIRMSTRLMRSPRVPWWPGSVETGGVHVHHLVFGIVTMMVAGTISFAGFATSPLYEICAVFFGIGIGLTIDEFALWVHLDDVYWAEEGRRSIDATVIAALSLCLILLGVRPFEIDGGSLGAVLASAAILLFHFAMVAICFAKHRMFHGIVGFLIPPFAIYGACRLGKPGSPWARRFYGERNPRKQERAERRFRADRRSDRFKEGVRTAIGGSTEAVYEEKIAERQSAANAGGELPQPEEQGHRGEGV
jgi:lysyl-tRNA synthetase class 2